MLVLSSASRMASVRRFRIRMLLVRTARASGLGSSVISAQRSRMSLRTIARISSSFFPDGFSSVTRKWVTAMPSVCEYGKQYDPFLVNFPLTSPAFSASGFRLIERNRHARQEFGGADAERGFDMRDIRRGGQFIGEES